MSTEKFILITTLNEKNKSGNASYVRRRFSITKDLKKAVIMLSACGIYKAYVNGKEVDTQVFLPGRTSTKLRLQYQEYDITSMLKEGENIIAALVGNGWYRGQKKFYCRLCLEYSDKTTQTIYTDNSWKFTENGPLGINDMKLGEIYDARKELSGWMLPGFDDSTWQSAVEGVYEGKMVPTEGERIMEHESLTPRAVLHTPDGAIVLDFGQNLAGYVEFQVKGKAGQKVTLVHGETLDEQGNFTLKNLSFTMSKKTGAYPQTIQYILREGQQSYKAQCSVQGFQYVKLENWPEEVKKENFRAIAVYSDLKQIGIFACSNEKINKLVENIRWSTKSNFLDVPTDCPTRERAGWTGDIMVYSIPATYQMDTYRFLKKWIQDVILEQNPDGSIKNIVPDGGMPTFMDGAAGWSDAIVKLPWVLYQFYGEKEILEIAYPAIQKHIAFMEQRAKKHKPWNLGKGGHWKHIIDTGFHWGEWLEPGSNMPTSALKGFTMPDAEVATAYYAWSTGKALQIARILGKREDADKYREQYKEILNAYQKAFMPGGKVDSERQCRYVRPVALELVSEKKRLELVKELNQKVIDNKYRVGTGFLSTPHVCNVLSDYGYAETAYRMLENEKAPGWLYEVNKGATSIWENWYGKDEQNKPTNSLNHYSPGAVVGWLYSRAAGIRPLSPGFAKVLIAPVVGGTITWVKCSYTSAAGEIVSNWSLENGKFVLDVTTPASTHVVLPDGTEHDVEAGSHQFTCGV